MFSGIITAVKPAKKKKHQKSITISIPKGWKLKKGDSIAVDGVCLTVATMTATTFSYNLMDETLSKTTFGLYLSGKVNLEPAARLSDRLNGHMLLGHIDVVGRIVDCVRRNDDLIMTFSFPKTFASLVVKKGSIGVDGVSLTIIDCRYDRFSVSLVHYTQEHTALAEKKVGDAINIEFDIMGKYVARQAELYAASTQR